MKINKLLIVSILSLGCIPLNAQTKQVIGGSLSGGLSSLNYKDVSTSISDRAGFAVGGTYTYFLNENWGIKSGLELSYYHSKSEIESIAGHVAAIDDEKEAFEYRYSIGGYTETQNTYLINIPLLLHFETSRPNAVSNFYASGGFKIGIPVSNKYKSEISSIKTQGYYSETNVIYDLLFRGFGTYTDQNVKGSINSNIQVAASLEFGIKNKIGENLFIYSGLYCDYGLNNLTKKNKTFLEYNTDEPARIKNNSILNSKYANGSNTSSFVNSVNTMSFGVKVNVAFEL